MLRSYCLYNQISQLQFDTGNTEIANQQELPILGMGTVIFKHHHTDGTHNNIILDNVLYMPKAFRSFYSTGVATQKGCEAHKT